jgi:hypothetical protein
METNPRLGEQIARLGELIESLVEKTRAGRLRWKPTASESTFATAFGGEYGLVIAQASLRSGPVYYLFLRDAEDRELFSISSLDTKIPVAAELPVLYELARRQALDVDKKVDELLRKLKGL